MTINKKNETKRGYQEAFKQFEVLRTTWPQAFPAEPRNIRPLASNKARMVADALGWSYPYTRAVLRVWKGRDAYCRAILRYPQRIDFDGSPSGEDVDDEACAQAKAQLEKIAERLVKKRAEKLRASKEGGAPDESLELQRTQIPVDAAA